MFNWILAGIFLASYPILTYSTKLSEGLMFNLCMQSIVEVHKLWYGGCCVCELISHVWKGVPHSHYPEDMHITGGLTES